MTSRWRDLIGSAEGSAVINIQAWFTRATLDVIGDGMLSLITGMKQRSDVGYTVAFDYRFGALDEAENELTMAYSNMM